MDSYDVMYAGMTGTLIVIYIIALVVGIVGLVGLWKVFTKAGKPGWACLVPLYYQYCLCEISWGNGWLFLLTLIPCVNIVVALIIMIKLAKSFGQGIGFGLGLCFLFPIFVMILGFGDAQYIGPQD